MPYQNTSLYTRLITPSMLLNIYSVGIITTTLYISLLTTTPPTIICPTACDTGQCDAWA